MFPQRPNFGISKWCFTICWNFNEDATTWTHRAVRLFSWGVSFDLWVENFSHFGRSEIQIAVLHQILALRRVRTDKYRLQSRWRAGCSWDDVDSYKYHKSSRNKATEQIWNWKNRGYFTRAKTRPKKFQPSVSENKDWGRDFWRVQKRYCTLKSCSKGLKSYVLGQEKQKRALQPVDSNRNYYETYFYSYCACFTMLGTEVAMTDKTEEVRGTRAETPLPLIRYNDTIVIDND